jgi:hypothetical protein
LSALSNLLQQAGELCAREYRIVPSTENNLPMGITPRSISISKQRCALIVLIHLNFDATKRRHSTESGIKWILEEHFVSSRDGAHYYPLINQSGKARRPKLEQRGLVGRIELMVEPRL